MVVGLGGSSVLDVAKLVAVLRDGDQSLRDVVGPKRVARRCTPQAQVATIAGTGSEAGIRAHDLIDGYARIGIALIGRYLRRAVQDGTDSEARAA